MFEDYLELDTGAALELEQALERRYNSGERNRMKVLRSLGAWLNIFNQQGQQPSQSDIEQGEQDSQLPASGVAPATVIELPAASSNDLQHHPSCLLLCIDDGTAKTILQQEILSEVTDDRELFTFLRKRHFAKRPWFALRSISGVSLAQVSLMET